MIVGIVRVVFVDEREMVGITPCIKIKTSSVF